MSSTKPLIHEFFHNEAKTCIKKEWVGNLFLDHSLLERLLREKKWSTNLPNSNHENTTLILKNNLNENLLMREILKIEWNKKVSLVISGFLRGENVIWKTPTSLKKLFYFIHFFKFPSSKDFYFSYFWLIIYYFHVLNLGSWLNIFFLWVVFPAMSDHFRQKI